MLLGSNLNPYKKLLEQQDFLKFQDDPEFNKQYSEYQKEKLKHEKFKTLNFEDEENQEEIKEVLEDFFNKRIEEEEQYIDTPEYLNSYYVDGVGSDFNDWITVTHLDEILAEFEDRVQEDVDFSKIVEDFYEEYKEDFTIDFSENDDYIGSIYHLGEVETYLHIRDEDEIEIFGNNYNLIDLLQYLPDDFIESLNLTQDINKDIIENKHRNYSHWDLSLFATHSTRYDVYLQNTSSVIDWFKDFLQTNDYYGFVQSEDNSAWEDIEDEEEE